MVTDLVTQNSGYSLQDALTSGKDDGAQYISIGGSLASLKAGIKTGSGKRWTGRSVTEPGFNNPEKNHQDARESSATTTKLWTQCSLVEDESVFRGKYLFLLVRACIPEHLLL
uniref:Uncharacterized protein n=1 Tax=Setaria digitata TaxID=48799 RepID=A0A915Q866_9BILA